MRSDTHVEEDSVAKAGGSSSGLSGGGAMTGGTCVETSRGGVGALVFWFVAANDVADTAVVDGVRACPVWGQFFWFVRARSDKRRDLRTDFERRRAGVLVFVLGLGLIVSCTGADGCVDGRCDVGTAVVVEGIGVGVAGVVVTAGGGGVSGDAGVGDEAGGVDIALAIVAIIGIDVVEGVGGVAGAAAAPVIVVVVVETWAGGV